MNQALSEPTLIINSYEDTVMSRAMGPSERANYKALVLEFVPLSSNHGAKLAIWLQ